MNLHKMSALLFVSGIAPQNFSSAKECGADGLLIDLEGSVPTNKKDMARKNALDYLHEEKNFSVGVRINSMGEKHGLLDLLAILDTERKPDFLVLAKVESAGEIAILDSLFEKAPIPYIALIESMPAMAQASQIVNASKNITGLSFGIKDLSEELGATINWENLLVIRMQILMAGKGANVSLWDPPFFQTPSSEEAFIEETQRAKTLGYTGKIALNTEQVKQIKKIFK